MNTVFGTGDGELGRVASYADPTVTMQAQPTVGGIGANLIRKGMLVRAYSALTGGSQRGNGAQVTAVNRSAGTFNAAALSETLIDSHAARPINGRIRLCWRS